MAMSILYPISRLIKGLVEDKESRMKETQKMMGLFQWVFMASWFVHHRHYPRLLLLSYLIIYDCDTE
jgi:hypothetical protein